MSDEPLDDVTLLRNDSSVSNSLSGEGTGEADAPRVLKQRFVLEEKLGSGGMGTVFRAKDLRKVEARDRQPYLAIKVLNNDFREHPEAFIALQREAAKSQILSHPNIVSIFDFDKDGDIPFMTMELLEGQELAALLRAYPNGLPEPMAWSVIRGICAGLSHAHEAGIVHADFKPGNVYVGPTNNPKILDFGIARAVQLTDVQGDDTLFDPARLAALTPAYASREMLAGDNTEPRDDLYSLGIVIYLILTGHHPYGRLSAEDAAKEGLKPERPKGVSRRQWQVIARCLSFNRQSRPADVAEVEKFLLTPSAWRSRSAMAAVATLVVALSANYLIGDAELSEVKQEVRQTTLVDVQLARLNSLLEIPEFTDSWEDTVSSEYAALAALAEENAGAEGEALVQDAREALALRIRDTYAERVLALEDLDRALVLLGRGGQYGPMDDTAKVLETRAVARVRFLLDNAQPDAAWLAALTEEIARLHQGFPASLTLAELELEVTESLELMTLNAIEANRTEEAELLLVKLGPRLFDAVVLDELEGSLEVVRSRLAAAQKERLLAQAEQARLRDLERALDASCLRLDVQQLHALSVNISDQSAALGQISERISGCLTQLAELDPDRAQSLNLAAEQSFGGELVLLTTVDPCRPSYLIGNGAQSGRQGYCLDVLPDGNPSPKLVVVPDDAGVARFAITREEISWAQFRQFCFELEGCNQAELERVAVDDRLPVTDISLATVQAFARWLSERTGFTYRLPTREEWLWAAQGDPDPNRNCQVSIDGVERGLSPVATETGQLNDYGLKNMLGNAQEWVLDGDSLHAMGGSFADPIGVCLADTSREHGGAGARDTGFRLVRELT
jgi:serine/threonine protein kinase